MDRWASPWLAAQAEYLRHLGSAPVAEVVERDGVYAVRTGVASNAENGVVSGGAVEVGADLVGELIRWLGERQLPASWLCAEGAARSRTARVLESAGCRGESAGSEMRRALERLDLEDAAAPAGVRMTAVASERELDGWLDVAGACRWFETAAERRAWRQLHLGLGLARSAPSRLYVCFRGDRAVGMASAFYTSEIVLLSAVGVVDDERRRGIGRAFALLRLREARERGCTLAVLAPSPDGAKLYNTLGFETHAQPPDRWFYLPTAS